MPMRLDVTGFPEMREEVKLLDHAVRTEATRRSVRRAARVILAAFIERAPVLDERTARSTAEDPGLLKATLRIAVRTVKGEGVIAAWIGPSKISKRVAHLVEYGHRLVKGGESRVGARGPVGPGKQIGEVPAHPFLRPGFEASWRESLAAFAVEMKAQLQRWVR